MGFNKRTKCLFITDTIKGFIINDVTIGPLVSTFLFVKLVKWGGIYFPIYVCIGFLCFQLLMMVLSPLIIEPCFHKDATFPEGSLKEKIVALAAKLKFPLTKLYTRDGSKRSGHSNAFLSGICNSKRIVLYDTLIADPFEEDEIVAILGHELGHWTHGHIWKKLGLMQCNILLMVCLFQLCVYNQNMYAQFGFDTMPVYIGYFLFSQIFAAIGPFLTFGMNYISRTFEYQADRFAVKVADGEKLHSGLIKMNKESKGGFNIDNLYSAYHYSHPPMVERLAAIEEALAKEL